MTDEPATSGTPPAIANSTLFFHQPAPSPAPHHHISTPPPHTHRNTANHTYNTKPHISESPRTAAYMSAGIENLKSFGKISPSSARAVLSLARQISATAQISTTLCCSSATGHVARRL
jgi:hypothetical protein